MNNIQGGHVTCYICEVQALAPQFSNSPWTTVSSASGAITEVLKTKIYGPDRA
jgi:hypothetical protein